MKKFLFSVLLVYMAFTSGCAQNQYGLQKGQLYFKERNPGNMMVDDNGQPLNAGVDTLHFIFIEVKGQKTPVFEKISYNGNFYTAAVTIVEPAQFIVGTRKKDLQKEIVQPQEGNKIWKLELESLVNIKADAKNSNRSLIITGKLAGKPFKWRFNKFIELTANEVY